MPSRAHHEHRDIAHCGQGTPSVLSLYVDRAADQLTLDRVQKFRTGQHMEAPDLAVVGRLCDHVADTGLEPTAYIAKCFDTHDIVFLGEFGRIAQAGRLLQELVPTLVDAGVWTLGVEWLLAEDQALIDRLLAAEDFDPTLAATLVFRWGMRHAAVFQEYVDVLEAAWHANQRLDSNAPAFKVLALDYDLDYSSVTDSADLLQPEAWPHLRSRGPAGRAMADRVHSELLSSRRRALISCSTTHALTHHRRAAHPDFDRIDVDVVNGRVLGLGNHVFGWRADRVTTVLLHQPLPGPAGYGADLVFAADGLLDLVFARPDGPKYPVGFDVSSGPFASLRCTTAHDEPLFGGWTNGYIFLDSVSDMLAPTPCFTPIDAEHIEEARRRVLPGALRSDDISVDVMRGAIETQATVAELVWRTVGI